MVEATFHAMAWLAKEGRYGLMGAGVGALVVVALPYAGAVLGAVARPLAKVLIRQGMLGFEAASEKLARAAEALQDLVAEVQAEEKAALSPRGNDVVTAETSGSGQEMN